MKSFEDIMEYFAVVEKFVKTSTASDETLQQLELKLQSLSAFIKAGKSTFEQKADHTQIIIDLINKRQNGI
jgi:hypothetical protein